MIHNIPEVKTGPGRHPRLLPHGLAERRRAALPKACKTELYECPVTIESESDARRHRRCGGPRRERAGVFLGNFGPETPETCWSSALTAR